MTTFGNNKVATGGYLDSTSAMRNALTGISNNITEQQKMKASQEQLALANARADAQLGISQAQEADRIKALSDKAMYDKTLSGIFSGMKDTKDVTTTNTDTIVTKPGIAGVTGNEAKIADINNLNAFNELRKEALLKGDFTPVNPSLNEGATHTKSNSFVPLGDATVPDGNSKQVVLREYPKIPGEGKRTYYETADGKKIDSLQKWFGDYEEVDNFKDTTTEYGPLGSETNPIAPAANYTINVNKAHAASSDKDKFIEDEVAKIITNREEAPDLVSTVKAVPAQTKKITKEITKQVKLKPEEQMSNLRNSILNSTLPGSYKMEAMGNLDKMFPKGKEMTFSDQLNFAKWQVELATKSSTLKTSVAKEQSFIADAYKQYPELQKLGIINPDVIKLHIQNKNKKEPVGYNITAEIYKLATEAGTDYDDAKAFLTRNKDAIAKLAPSGQKILMAELQNKIANESGLDIGNWLPSALGGGTDTGDVLQEVTLK